MSPIVVGFFSPTAQTRGIGSGFLSINKSGLDDGVRGVFEGNGGPITSIALSSGPMFAGTAGASINDAGTVVFSASLDAGGSGIFTGNGGPTSTVALSGGGVTGFGGAPEINDAGRVLYGASLGGGNGGIFLRGGGQPDATVALTSGPMFNAIVGATINSQGVVAFSAVLDSGSEGVFPGSGGPITTTGLEPFPDGMGPSINDFGKIAFTGGGPGEGFGTSIRIGDADSVSTLVSNAGPFAVFGRYPVINNSGTVIFLSGLDDGRVELFTGPDPVADKVIVNNEPLFGSIVTSFIPNNVESTGVLDMNDAGQIAFHYVIADGREGIAIATPVPQPTVTVILLISFAGFTIGARKRRLYQLQQQLNRGT